VTFRTGREPSIDIEPELHGIGRRTPVRVVFEEQGRGLGEARVELVQGDRVEVLAEWLIDQLLKMKYANGSHLVRLYGPRSTGRRGGTLALNFCTPSGEIIDQAEVEQLANERRISLRTGCFCNPGAGEVALGLSAGELQSCFSASPERMSYDDFRNCIQGGSGAVRVSVGLASNFADVWAFAEFARGFLRS
jgi:selenocysteine lyase/cysteine desulfurase